MTTECPNCGDEFERIGQHWALSSTCDYPPLTQKQQEITTGLLMGDGYIDLRKGKNPRLRSKMISKEYLQYIDDQFGILSNGVLLELTAEENAQQKRDTGFRPDAQAENYSDLYTWRSRSHPELKEFADWYSSGTKVWPEDIELTPTVLKHWYCGDGHWNNTGAHNRIVISMANEVENTEKVDKMFESVGLPTPSNYAISDINGGSRRCNAEFTVDQSKELWEYMGEPLPDFEYKWPGTETLIR